MGLGAPKKRSKLSNDPNNTAWSRSATKYGQRILQSRGWTPGQPLGASGAAYSDLRSVASASHIRITHKDDNLGLGAKHDAAHAINTATGLDVFQDLLGRLNGRSSTDLQKDRIQRSNLRNPAYINQRSGAPRFVSGGLLVRENLTDLTKDRKDALNTSQQLPSHRLEDGTVSEADRPQQKGSGARKQRKRKILGNDNRLEKTSNGVYRRVIEAQSPRSPSAEPDKEPHTSSKDICDQSQTDKVRRRAEKADRKLKRQVRRDARHSLKVRKQSSALPSSGFIGRSGSDFGEIVLASHPPREASASARESYELGGARLAVRHRYIQHKSMCMMDDKALNEIFMITS